MSPVQVCVFNPVTTFIDQIPATATGPAAVGVPIITNGNGLIDASLLGTGASSTAGQSISSGQLVNLYNSGGTLHAQVASAQNTGTAPSGANYPLQAQGFANSGSFTGTTFTVNFVGTFSYTDGNSEFSASNIGQEVFLSAVTPGGVTLTPPAALEQTVGYVISFTSPNIVGISFVSGFQDFSHISGVNPIVKGGTGATSGAAALINLIGGSPTTGESLVWSGTAWIPGSPTITFDAIGTGTNTTATMTVGTGASIVVTGTGVVEATQLWSVLISSVAPSAGQVLTATSATVADWETPVVVALEVNGTPLSSQTLLNLQGDGGSISVMDEGSGTAQISGPAFLVEFAPLSSQTTIDFISGQAMSVFDFGNNDAPGGDVTFSAYTGFLQISSGISLAPFTNSVFTYSVTPNTPTTGIAEYSGSFSPTPTFSFSQQIYVSGFANAANNGTFAQVSSPPATNTTVYVSNAAAVTESGAHASLAFIPILPFQYGYLLEISTAGTLALPNVTHWPSTNNNTGASTFPFWIAVYNGTVSALPIVNASFPTGGLFLYPGQFGRFTNTNDGTGWHADFSWVPSFAGYNQVATPVNITASNYAQYVDVVGTSPAVVNLPAIDSTFNDFPFFCYVFNQTTGVTNGSITPNGSDTINGTSSYVFPIGQLVWLIPIFGSSNWIAVPFLAIEDTAAGTDTDIQYNGAGILAGSSDFTWNNTTRVLTVNGTDVFGYSVDASVTPALSTVTGTFELSNSTGVASPIIEGPFYTIEYTGSSGGTNVSVSGGGVFATTSDTTTDGINNLLGWQVESLIGSGAASVATDVIAMQSIAAYFASGTVTGSLVGYDTILRLQTPSGTNNVTNIYGVRVNTPSTAGTGGTTDVTNQYGLFVDNQLSVSGLTAANVWAIKTGTGRVEFGDNVLIDGTITKYNSSATAGNGVSSVSAATSQKSETAADPSVLSFTPPATAGSYRVRFVLSVSAATAATLGWTATWTDSNGNPQTPTNLALLPSGSATWALTTGSISAAGNYHGYIDIDVNNSGTAIVVSLTASGTFTALVSATIERII